MAVKGTGQRGTRSARRPRRRSRSPGYAAKAEARLRALHAVARMRHQRLSLAEAARLEDTSTRTVLQYGGRALRKRHGQYEATPIDDLRRPMRVLTERGYVVMDIPTSTAARRLSRYWHAVDVYLQKGDRRLLRPFAGRSFRAEGHLVPFLTDLHLLDRLGDAGQVSFEEIYEITA